MKMPKYYKIRLFITILLVTFIPLFAQDKEKSLTEPGVAERELKDGVYEAKSSFITVSVAIKNNKIEDIKILYHGGGGRKYEDMVRPLINRIMKKQSAKVDSITGVTVSSNYLKEAVDEALRKASHCASCEK